MVLDITLFKAGSQKCIDYKWAFFYKFYTFLFGYNTVHYFCLDISSYNTSL